MKIAILGNNKESAEGIAHLIGLLRTTLPETDFVRFVNYEMSKKCVEIYQPDMCIFYDSDKQVDVLEIAMNNIGGTSIRLFEFLEANKDIDYKLSHYLSMFSFAPIGDRVVDVNKLVEFEKWHSQLRFDKLRDKDIHTCA